MPRTNLTIQRAAVRCAGDEDPKAFLDTATVMLICDTAWEHLEGHNLLTALIARLPKDSPRRERSIAAIEWLLSEVSKREHGRWKRKLLWGEDPGRGDALSLAIKKKSPELVARLSALDTWGGADETERSGCPAIPALRQVLAERTHPTYTAVIAGWGGDLKTNTPMETAVVNMISHLMGPTTEKLETEFFQRTVNLAPSSVRIPIRNPLLDCDEFNIIEGTCGWLVGGGAKADRVRALASLAKAAWTTELSAGERGGLLLVCGIQTAGCASFCLKDPAQLILDAGVFCKRLLKKKPGLDRRCVVAWERALGDKTVAILAKTLDAGARLELCVDGWNGDWFPTLGAGWSADESVIPGAVWSDVFDKVEPVEWLPMMLASAARRGKAGGGAPMMSSLVPDDPRIDTISAVIRGLGGQPLESFRCDVETMLPEAWEPAWAKCGVALLEGRKTTSGKMRKRG